MRWTTWAMPKSYDDYHEMLDQEKIDIVICCAENAQHPAVVEACAQHGVHVIIEKPMAALSAGRSANGPDCAGRRH